LNPQALERRALVAEIGVVVLLGVAFGEMARSVGQSLDEGGVTVGLVCLFLIFFTTSLRFGIGDHLYLNSAARSEPSWPFWLSDFVVIAFEVVILIFLGGSATVELVKTSKFGFFPLLITLYAVDFAWVVFTMARQALAKASSGEAPLLQWAVLDVAMVACVLLARWAFGSYTANDALVVLAILAFGVFVVDVWLMRMLLQGQLVQRDRPTEAESRRSETRMRE